MTTILTAILPDKSLTNRDMSAYIWRPPAWLWQTKGTTVLYGLIFNRNNFRQVLMINEVVNVRGWQVQGWIHF